MNKNLQLPGSNLQTGSNLSKSSNYVDRVGNVHEFSDIQLIVFHKILHRLDQIEHKIDVIKPQILKSHSQPRQDTSSNLKTVVTTISTIKVQTFKILKYLKYFYKFTISILVIAMTSWQKNVSLQNKKFPRT